MLLFVLISSLCLSAVYGADSGCSDDTIPACSDRTPSEGECCVLSGDGTACISETEASSCPQSSDTTTTGSGAGTTEEIDCDNSDLTEWRLDYIGKSTQFRIYDPCDSKFIKFKMDSLIEYDGDDNKKTVAKEESFASSKDWEWGENSNTIQDYQGNDAIYNAFIADTLTKNDAIFTLETYFFQQPVVICCDDEGNNMTLSRDSLKFNVKIENWQMAKDNNYLVLCIGIMTNKVQDMDDDPDTKTYYINNFILENIATADCMADDGTTSGINVDIDDEGGNGKNHLDICYTFDSCDGNITYDPILQIGNNANSKNIFIAIITMSIISLFVV